ncbi:MAG: FmdB family zinc ribbon protein [Fidelibacterota bacterium]
MPMYDYVCKACGHEFEHMQRMSDDPLKTCPKCQQGEVVRKITGGTGVIFKGSGFYKTDYADKKSEPKKETKPAANNCCANGACKH